MPAYELTVRVDNTAALNGLRQIEGQLGQVGQAATRMQSSLNTRAQGAGVAGAVSGAGALGGIKESAKEFKTLGSAAKNAAAAASMLPMALEGNVGALAGVATFGGKAVAALSSISAALGPLAIALGVAALGWKYLKQQEEEDARATAAASKALEEAHRRYLDFQKDYAAAVAKLEENRVARAMEEEGRAIKQLAADYQTAIEAAGKLADVQRELESARTNSKVADLESAMQRDMAKASGRPNEQASIRTGYQRAIELEKSAGELQALDIEAAKVADQLKLLADQATYTARDLQSAQAAEAAAQGKRQSLVAWFNEDAQTQRMDPAQRIARVGELDDAEQAMVEAKGRVRELADALDQIGRKQLDLQSAGTILDARIEAAGKQASARQDELARQQEEDSQKPEKKKGIAPNWTPAADSLTRVGAILGVSGGALQDLSRRTAVATEQSSKHLAKLANKSDTKTDTAATWAQ